MSWRAERGHRRCFLGLLHDCVLTAVQLVVKHIYLHRKLFLQFSEFKGIKEPKETFEALI